MRILRIVKVTAFILRSRKAQNKFNDDFIDRYLSPYEEKYEAKINATTYERIRRFYSQALPLTCSAFASIYKRELSPAEREHASLAAIITPLIDDFTDQQGLSLKQLDDLMSFPPKIFPSNLEEAVVRGILDDLVRKVTSPAGTINEFRRTLAAQQWSEKQLEKEISEEEVRKITYEKGGSSLLLMHYLIKEIPDPEIIDLANQVGGTLQLCNDIFDIYKDAKDGVKTLATLCEDFEELEEFYFNECIIFNRMAYALNDRKRDMRFFTTFFSMLLGRGMVALNQLSRLQKKYGGGPLPIPQLDRKLLICDMEKPVNILRSVKYTHRIMKKG